MKYAATPHQLLLRRAHDFFQGIFSLDMIQEQHRLTSSDEPGQSCRKRGASEGIEAGKVDEPDPVEPRDSLLPPGTIILGTHACITIITAIIVAVTAVVIIIADVAAESDGFCENFSTTSESPRSDLPFRVAGLWLFSFP